MFKLAPSMALKTLYSSYALLVFVAVFYAVLFNIAGYKLAYFLNITLFSKYFILISLYLSIIPLFSMFFTHCYNYIFNIVIYNIFNI